jgi:copper chaperone CopZ
MRGGFIFVLRRFKTGFGAGIGESGNAMAKKAKELRLKAEGIICSGCAEDMENILRGKKGVLDASVNYSDGTIHIRYDPDLLDEKRIFLAVRKLGFKTRVTG